MATLRVAARFGEARPADVPWYYFAWTTDGPDGPVCHFAGLRPARLRVRHELEHALDPSFTNEAHHPWHHLCVRCVFPVRFDWHGAASTNAQAAALVRDGFIAVGKH